MKAFYSERRNYQNRIKDLESVIADLNKKLGSSTETTKEKEASITDINLKLRGLSKAKVRKKPSGPTLRVCAHCFEQSYQTVLLFSPQGHDQFVPQ